MKLKRRKIKKPKKNSVILSTSRKKSFRSRHWLPNFLRARPVKFILLAVALAVMSGGIIYNRVPVTRTDVVNNDIPFETKYVDDGTVELGQQQVRQEGENGTKEIEYSVKHTFAGKELSRTVAHERIIKAPVNKTIAKGTKKYQFMWCSNGAYRYYSNDEFKNPYTGFTHQSPDFCTQNKQGHMTSLADSAPQAQAPATTYQRYTPTYTSPTTCNTQYHTYGGWFDPSATTTCY